ncbi:MAG: hypothetical protein OXR73_10825, partial [Myxococcales bacterium]|nr:hypothetical protein [Myxococcales bacterium]
DAGADAGTDASLCMVGGSCDKPSCTDVNTVEIDGDTRSPITFGGGADQALGCYKIVYVEGEFLTHDGSVGDVKYSVGTYLYSDDLTAGNHVGNRIAEGANPVQGAEETTWAGTEVVFQHCGGKIAVGNGDNYPGGFSDNADGSPNPRWTLQVCTD